MILDIGCGDSEKSQFPLMKPNVIHADLNSNISQLDIVCDISNLPFKDDTFDIVHASHVIEHILNPCKAVRELKRVSKNYVVIIVPNGARMYFPEDPDHLFTWTKYTFKQFLEKTFPIVTMYLRERKPKVRYRKIRTFAKIFARRLIQPKELYAVCRKRIS